MDKYKEVFLTTTDTVTGIGAPISKNNEDVIFELKERPRSKPLIIMIGSIEQAREFKEWNKNAEELAEEVWPGNVTIALSKDLALRIPDVPELISLLKKIGPCYMSSANKSGTKVASLDESKKIFKEVKTYYDFGQGTGSASKIIDANTRKVYR